MTVEQAAEFFDKSVSGASLRREEAEIADQILEEIRSRLRFLNDVGLEYLMLDRLTSTLSGGEAQRIQLATSLGSRLVGTLYVLDEPSIGLHSRDTRRLIGILHGLRDLGNTVLVVEHDPEVMRASDRILDLGPGAGEHGGKIIATGSYEEIQHAPGSLTGRYLADDLRIQIPANRRKPGRQHPPETSGLHLLPTYIARQRGNAQTGDCRLLQPDHIVAQETRFEGPDKFFLAFT